MLQNRSDMPEPEVRVDADAQADGRSEGRSSAGSNSSARNVARFHTVSQFYYVLCVLICVCVRQKV